MIRRRRQTGSLLFLCYQYYAISEDKAVTYNITDLTRLVWLGDKRIADFLVSWNTVIGGMKGTLGEAPIHQWFYEQLKKSTPLKEEVTHYTGAAPPGPAAPANRLGKAADQTALHGESNRIAAPVAG
jgi:hypothetical protein